MEGIVIIKKLAAAVFAALGLAACSGGFGTMDGIMNSWNGARLEEAIAQWGYPHAERRLGTHHLYYWYKNMQLAMPATTTGTVTYYGGNTAYVNATTTGGGVTDWNCTRMLDVNEAGIIVGWQWEGNNCPFAEAFQYADWRRQGGPVTAPTSNATASSPAPAAAPTPPPAPAPAAAPPPAPAPAPAAAPAPASAPVPAKAPASTTDTTDTLPVGRK